MWRRTRRRPPLRARQPRRPLQFRVGTVQLTQLVESTVVLVSFHPVDLMLHTLVDVPVWPSKNFETKASR